VAELANEKGDVLLVYFVVCLTDEQNLVWPIHYREDRCLELGQSQVDVVFHEKLTLLIKVTTLSVIGVQKNFFLTQYGLYVCSKDVKFYIDFKNINLPWKKTLPKRGISENHVNLFQNRKKLKG
jgi:hypothetical protein